MESVRQLWKFLLDVWREIHPRKGRVTWPTAKAIRTSTLVVIVSSVLLSLYITLCDGVVRLFVYPR
jgi:preprotein translocase SecE subunit